MTRRTTRRMVGPRVVSNVRSATRSPSIAARASGNSSSSALGPGWGVALRRDRARSIRGDLCKPYRKRVSGSGTRTNLFSHLLITQRTVDRLLGRHARETNRQKAAEFAGRATGHRGPTKKVFAIRYGRCRRPTRCMKGAHSRLVNPHPVRMTPAAACPRSANGLSVASQVAEFVGWTS